MVSLELWELRMVSPELPGQQRVGKLETGPREG